MPKPRGRPFNARGIALARAHDVEGCVRWLSRLGPRCWMTLWLDSGGFWPRRQPVDRAVGIDPGAHHIGVDPDADQAAVVSGKPGVRLGHAEVAQIVESPGHA